MRRGAASGAVIGAKQISGVTLWLFPIVTSQGGIAEAHTTADIKSGQRGAWPIPAHAIQQQRPCQHEDMAT